VIDWKRLKALLGERKVVVALVLVAIVVIWMFRFESFGYQRPDASEPNNWCHLRHRSGVLVAARWAL
jgi:hypothetical protein